MSGNNEGCGGSSGDEDMYQYEATHPNTLSNQQYPNLAVKESHDIPEEGVQRRSNEKEEALLEPNAFMNGDNAHTKDEYQKHVGDRNRESQYATVENSAFEVSPKSVEITNENRGLPEEVSKPMYAVCAVCSRD